MSGGPLGQLGVAMAGETTPPQEARREIVERRTARSRTWKLPDGSFALELHQAPIHYPDPSSGVYLPIDASLEETSTPRGRVWRNRANSFRLTLPAVSPDSWASIEQSAAAVSFQPVSGKLPDWARAQASTAQPLPASGRGRVYPKAFDAADIVYESLPCGLKETIVLDAWRGRSVFSFDVVAVGCTPTMTASGAIEFRSTVGTGTAFVVPPPVMADSARPEGAEGAVRYEIRASGPVWRLDVVCDRAWLSDPARSYPVRIDPTIKPIYWDTDSGDAYVAQGYPTSNYGVTSDLRTGYYSGVGHTRTYVKFNTAAYTSALRSIGATVTSALLQMYCYYRYQQSATRITAFRCDGAWSENSITWNTQPAYDTLTTYDDVSQGEWGHWDITAAARDWVAGTRTDNGIMTCWNVSQSDPNSYTKFYSFEAGATYDPQMWIYYTLKPRLSVTEPGPEAPFILGAGDLGPEARWVYADGGRALDGSLIDGKSQSRIECQVATKPAGTVVWASGQRTVTPTQTAYPLGPPAGGWQAGRYFMRMRIAGKADDDGVYWSEWSEWRPFECKTLAQICDAAGIEGQRAKDAIGPGAAVDLPTGRLEIAREDLSGPGRAGAIAIGATYRSDVTSDADGLGRGWRLGVPSLVASDEVAPNPGFEQVVSGDPSGWAISDATSTSSDPAVVRTGNYSVKITKSTTSTAVNLANAASSAQGHPVWPGQRVRMSAWARSQGMSVDSSPGTLGSRGVYIRAYFADMNGTSVMTTNSANFVIGTQTAWVPITLEATVPPGAYRLRFLLEMKNAKGTVWLDDAHVGDGTAVHTDPDGSGRVLAQTGEGVWSRDPLSPGIALRRPNLARGVEVSGSADTTPWVGGASTDGDLLSTSFDSVIWKADGTSWLRYDLSRPRMVSAASLRLYDLDHSRVYTYRVEVSEDASSWTQVVPAAGEGTSVAGVGWRHHTFAPVRARYLRVVALGTSNNSRLHVCEFEVPQTTLGDVPVAFTDAGVLRGAGDQYGNTSYASWEGTRLAGLWERASAGATRGIELHRAAGALVSLAWRGVTSTGTSTYEPGAVRYASQGATLALTRPLAGREVTAVAYGYDGAGRVCRIADADGYAIGIAYDAAGRVATVTDAAGAVKTYAYGAQTVTIKTQDASGTPGPGSVVSFDASVGGQTTCVGLLPAGSSVPPLPTTYAHDAYGHVGTLTGPTGIPDTVDADSRGNALRTVVKRTLESTATYNDHDLIETSRDPKGNLSVFRYDKDTRALASDSVAVGDADEDGQVSASRTRDGYGNVITGEPAASTARNLLVNGTFEEGWDGWTKYPAGTGNITLADSQGGAYLGEKYVDIDPQDNSTWLESDKVSVEAGALYQVSAWANGRGQLCVAGYRSDGTLYGVTTVTPVLAGNSLERVCGSYSVPGTVRKIAVRLFSPNRCSTRFDNVRLEKANAAGCDDIADNGSFEMTSAVLPTPTHWTRRQTGTAVQEATTAVGGVEGAKAVVLVTTQEAGDTGGGYFYSDLMHVREGETYTVSGWMRTDSVTTTDPAGGAWIRVWTYAGSTLASTTLVTPGLVTGTTDWTRYVREIKIPPGVNHILVHCHAMACGGKTYFDAVSVMPVGGVRTTVYDEATHSFAVRTTTERGHVLTSEADQYGRAVSCGYAERAGAATETLQTSAYDALGRLVRTETAPGSGLGISARFAYTDAGRLSEVTDPRGNTTRLGYDAAGRLVSVTDAAGMRSETVYDGLGRVAAVMAPRSGDETGSVIASNHYDALGRLERAVGRSLSGESSTRSVAYDAAGRVAGESVTSSGAPAATAAYTYDDLSRVTSQLNSGPAGSVLTTTAYDKASLPTRVHFSALDASATITNSFLKTGQWWSTTGLGAWWGFDTSDDGRLLSASSPFASRLLCYDETGRLSTVRLGYKASQVASGVIDFAHVSVGYDGRERIGRVGYSEDVGPDYADTYGYDAADRLTSWSRTGDIPAAATYGYDAAGNLTARTQGGVTTTFSHDAVNRLATMTAGGVSTTFGYDRLGRLCTRTAGAETTSYAWDASGRLSGVRSGTTTITYLYGADGMRARKTVEASGTTATVTESVWANGQLIAERDSDGTLIKYLYGPGGIPLQIRVTRTVGGTATTSKYFYQLDHAGSVVALTDEWGSAVARYAYDPWGRPVGGISGTDAWLQARQPLRYRGYCWDAETGMYYLPARYYDPALARFISPDPAPADASDPLSLNVYAYCVDDPVNREDPDGAWSFFAFLRTIWSRLFSPKPKTHLWSGFRRYHGQGLRNVSCLAFYTPPTRTKRRAYAPPRRFQQCHDRPARERISAGTFERESDVMMRAAPDSETEIASIGAPVRAGAGLALALATNKVDGRPVSSFLMVGVGVGTPSGGVVVSHGDQVRMGYGYVGAHAGAIIGGGFTDSKELKHYAPNYNVPGVTEWDYGTYYGADVTFMFPVVQLTGPRIY